MKKQILACILAISLLSNSLVLSAEEISDQVVENTEEETIIETQDISAEENPESSIESELQEEDTISSEENLISTEEESESSSEEIIFNMDDPYVLEDFVLCDDEDDEISLEGIDYINSTGKNNVINKIISYARSLNGSFNNSYKGKAKQCCAYANYVTSNVFGADLWNSSFNPTWANKGESCYDFLRRTQAKPGDILFSRYATSMHYMVVLDYDASGLRCTDGWEDKNDGRTKLNVDKTYLYNKSKYINCNAGEYSGSVVDKHVSYRGTTYCLYKVKNDIWQRVAGTSINPEPSRVYPAPVFESANVTNVDYKNGSYKVDVVIISESGLNRVQYPTWTTKNGQDDLASSWPSGNIVSLGNNRYSSSFTVYIRDHNNERGEYITHIYAYGNDGKATSTGVSINMDMPNFEVTDVDKSVNVNHRGKYCQIYITFNSSVKIDRVQFPTWTEARGQDDIDPSWGDSNQSKGRLSKYKGKYSVQFTARASDHNNEIGKYITHVYAYDIYGQSHCISGISYELINPPEPKLIDAYIDYIDEENDECSAKVLIQDDLDLHNKVACLGASRSTTEYIGNNIYETTIKFTKASRLRSGNSIIIDKVIITDGYGNPPHIDNISCKIVELNSISIPNEIVVLPGEVRKIEPQYTPANTSYKKLNWSYEGDIECNSDGEVTGYEDGASGTVFASSKDGKYKAECKVIVDKYRDKYQHDIWVDDVPNYIYTGKAIMPEPVVFDGTRRLRKGVDYTISYKNNVNANNTSDEKKAPTIIISSKGSYFGKEVVNFDILPQNIENTEFEVDDITLVYNSKLPNKVQQPKPVLMWNGKKLVANINYDISYPDKGENAYKLPGTYKILLTGKGNFTGSRIVNLTITDNKLISKTSVSPIKSQTYTGSQILPDITVIDGKKILEPEVDYTVEYVDNVAPGKATIIITGLNDYSGVKKVNFNINGIAISKAVIKNVPKEISYKEKSFTQDDFDSKPILTVTANRVSTDLIEGKDYYVTYEKNLNAGQATMLFHGLGMYTGTAKRNFKIAPYDINTDADNLMKYEGNLDAIYSKGGSKPSLSIYFGGRLLREGSDYSLNYSGNTSVNDGSGKSVPKIIITGKGNFKGIHTIDYKINSKDIAEVTIKLADKTYANRKNAFKSVPKLIDIDGKVLAVNKDYDKNCVYKYMNETTLADGSVRSAGDLINANDILPAGTEVLVTVTGKGNYHGTISGSYRITAKDIKSVRVNAITKTYTGKPITLSKEDIELKLKVNRDFVTVDSSMYDIVEDSYVNNVKKGIAKVDICGKGDFGGTKTITFKIQSKGFKWWWRDLINVDY